MLQSLSHSLQAVKVLLLRSPSKLSLFFICHLSCMFWLSIVSPDSSFTPLPSNSFHCFCSNWNRHLELLCFLTSESQLENLTGCLRLRQAVRYFSYWNSIHNVYCVFLCEWTVLVYVVLFFFFTRDTMTKQRLKQNNTQQCRDTVLSYISYIAYGMCADVLSQSLSSVV